MITYKFDDDYSGICYLCYDGEHRYFNNLKIHLTTQMHQTALIQLLKKKKKQGNNKKKGDNFKLFQKIKITKGGFELNFENI